MNINTNINIKMSNSERDEYLKKNIKEAIKNCSNCKKVKMITHSYIIHELQKLEKSSKIQIQKSKCKFKRKMYREKLVLAGCTFDNFLEIKSHKKHNFYEVIITIN